MYQRNKDKIPGLKPDSVGGPKNSGPGKRLEMVAQKAKVVKMAQTWNKKRLRKVYEMKLVTSISRQLTALQASLATESKVVCPAG